MSSPTPYELENCEKVQDGQNHLPQPGGQVPMMTAGGNLYVRCLLYIIYM